jgi:hypothetical protein
MKSSSLLFSAMLISFLFFADFKKTNAQVSPGEVLEAIDAVENLFCPKVPQPRCKNGFCQTGACISFRPACAPDKLGKPC